MQTLPLSGTDIVVQSADGDLLAVVEIRNPINLSLDYAVTIRRNLIEHSRFNRAAQFFLIVSQDVGYLWDQSDFPPVEDTPPTVTFPMAPIVERYRSPQEPNGRLPSESLKGIVDNWFWDLSRNAERPHTSTDAVLSQTRFLDLFRGSRINYEFELERD